MKEYSERNTLWQIVGCIFNIYPRLSLRAECFLICISSRGGTPDIGPLLQEEPENGRPPQKAWAATQEPRCWLQRSGH